jgi:hypothetical protein
MFCVTIGEANSRQELPSLHEIRSRCIQHLERMRPDHMRRLNPTPYKVLILLIWMLFMSQTWHLIELAFHSVPVFEQVSVSAKLYDFIHFLWLNEAPVGELQWSNEVFRASAPQANCNKLIPNPNKLLSRDQFLQMFLPYSCFSERWGKNIISKLLSAGN